MRFYSKGLFILDLHKEYGNLMLLPSVGSSCGWPPTIDAGLLTDLLDEASPTQPDVCCVIKKRRISNIFSSVAYSPGNFGSLSSSGLASPHSPPSPKIFHSMTGGRRRKPVAGELRKGLNSLIILGAWSVWRHRNDCVFNGTVPNMATDVILAMDEVQLWSLAGARDLSLLSAMGEGS